MAFFRFDPNSVAPQAPMGVIPAGDYIVQITESEMVDLKSGNGQALKLTMEVIDGQYKGRKLWERLNVIHTNEKAQSIAQSQLSAICHALGVTKLEDTAILHFKPMKVGVKVEAADDKYPESNRVTGFSAATAGGSFSQPKPAAPTAPAAPAGKAPAWATQKAA